MYSVLSPTYRAASIFSFSQNVEWRPLAPAYLDFINHHFSREKRMSAATVAACEKAHLRKPKAEKAMVLNQNNFFLTGNMWLSFLLFSFLAGRFPTNNFLLRSWFHNQRLMQRSCYHSFDLKWGAMYQFSSLRRNVPWFSVFPSGSAHQHTYRPSFQSRGTKASCLMKKGKNPGVLVVPTSAVGLQPQMEETSEAYRVQILTPGMSTAHIIRLGLT